MLELAGPDSTPQMHEVGAGGGAPGGGGRAWEWWAGGAMKWRIMLDRAGPDSTPQMHEVGAGERSPTGHAAATLGLSLEQGKAIPAVVQRHLVAAPGGGDCRG